MTDGLGRRNGEHLPAREMSLEKKAPMSTAGLGSVQSQGQCLTHLCGLRAEAWPVLARNRGTTNPNSEQMLLTVGHWAESPLGGKGGVSTGRGYSQKPLLRAP